MAKYLHKYFILFLCSIVCTLLVFSSICVLASDSTKVEYYKMQPCDAGKCGSSSCPFGTSVNGCGLSKCSSTEPFYVSMNVPYDGFEGLPEKLGGYTLGDGGATYHSRENCLKIKKIDFSSIPTKDKDKIYKFEDKRSNINIAGFGKKYGYTCEKPSDVSGSLTSINFDRLVLEEKIRGLSVGVDVKEGNLPGGFYFSLYDDESDKVYYVPRQQDPNDIYSLDWKKVQGEEFNIPSKTKIIDGKSVTVYSFSKAVQAIWSKLVDMSPEKSVWVKLSNDESKKVREGLREYVVTRNERIKELDKLNIDRKNLENQGKNDLLDLSGPATVAMKVKLFGAIKFQVYKETFPGNELPTDTQLVALIADFQRLLDTSRTGIFSKYSYIPADYPGESAVGENKIKIMLNIFYLRDNYGYGKRIVDDALRMTPEGAIAVDTRKIEDVNYIICPKDKVPVLEIKSECSVPEDCMGKGLFFQGYTLCTNGKCEHDKEKAKKDLSAKIQGILAFEQETNYEKDKYLYPKESSIYYKANKAGFFAGTSRFANGVSVELKDMIKNPYVEGALLTSFVITKKFPNYAVLRVELGGSPSDPILIYAEVNP